LTMTSGARWVLPLWDPGDDVSGKGGRSHGPYPVAVGRAVRESVSNPLPHVANSPQVYVDHPDHPGESRLWIIPSATTEAPTEARHQLAEWLKTVGWPKPDRDNVVLAVYEALANVVDHAYRRQPAGPAQLYVWQVRDSESQHHRIVAGISDYDAGGPRSSTRATGGRDWR
jgi:Histidine kinase-like ATPase domain